MSQTRKLNKYRGDCCKFVVFIFSIYYLHSRVSDKFLFRFFVGFLLVFSHVWCLNISGKISDYNSARISSSWSLQSTFFKKLLSKFGVLSLCIASWRKREVKEVGWGGGKRMCETCHYGSRILSVPPQPVRKFVLDKSSLARQETGLTKSPTIHWHAHWAVPLWLRQMRDRKGSNSFSTSDVCRWPREAQSPGQRWWFYFSLVQGTFSELTLPSHL